MKKFVSLLVFLFFFVVGIQGQQIDVSVGLPIGSNVNNHPAHIGMSIGDNYIAGWNVSEEFDYTPLMGNLETVVKNHFQVLVDKFTLAPGSEEDEYGLGIIVNPGPFMASRFHLQGGIIPREVLDVKLDYGGTVIFHIPGVDKVTMEVRKSGKVVGKFSSDDPGDSPCRVASVQSYLTIGDVSLDSRYVVPSLYDGAWDEGNFTLYESGLWARLNILNGLVIDYSSPPPAFLKFPEPKLEIAIIADGFEFSISNTSEQPFTIESTTDFKVWELYPTVELTSVVGKKSFSAKALGTNRFFRLHFQPPTKQ